MTNDIQYLSRKDNKRIVQGLNKNQNRVVVVKKKNGDDVKVYNIGKYMNFGQQMREAIQKYKPWVKRQKSLLGPIGNRPLGVTTDLSRTAIYEAL